MGDNVQRVDGTGASNSHHRPDPAALSAASLMHAVDKHDRTLTMFASVKCFVFVWVLDRSDVRKEVEARAQKFPFPRSAWAPVRMMSVTAWEVPRAPSLALQERLHQAPGILSSTQTMYGHLDKTHLLCKLNYGTARVFHSS